MGKEQEKAALIRRLCAVGERYAPSLQIIYHKTTNGTQSVPFMLFLIFSFHAEAGGDGGIRRDEHRAVAVIHDHARLGPVRLAQAAYRRHVNGDVLALACLGVVGRKLGRLRDRLVRRLDACCLLYTSDAADEL